MTMWKPTLGIPVWEAAALAAALAAATAWPSPAAAETIIVKGQPHLITITIKDGTRPCDFRMDIHNSGVLMASWRVSSDRVLTVSANGRTLNSYMRADGKWQAGAPVHPGECPCDIKSDIGPDRLPLLTWTMKTENGNKMRVVVNSTGFFSYSFTKPDGSVGDVMFHQASMLNK
jgi:hypothetical protein